MDNVKNMKKLWLNSLSFLDNSTLNGIIVVILFLYTSQIFSNINSFVGNFYNLDVIRVIVLLLIIYIAPKDTTIAILLALSYCVSLHYMMNSENFSNINKSKSSLHVIEEEVRNIKKKINEEDGYLKKQITEEEGKKMDPKSLSKIKNKRIQPVQPVKSINSTDYKYSKYLKRPESFGNQYDMDSDKKKQNSFYQMFLEALGAGNNQSLNELPEKNAISHEGAILYSNSTLNEKSYHQLKKQNFKFFKIF
jgi:hypothetical protein